MAVISHRMFRLVVKNVSKNVEKIRFQGLIYSVRQVHQFQNSFYQIEIVKYYHQSLPT